MNTLYQLYALKSKAPLQLEQAETLLMMPELLRYFLTGTRQSEWTIASTTQLGNPYTRTWDRELIQRLGFPPHLFLEPVQPGTVAGPLLPEIAREVGFSEVPVIAVAEHDTASAIAAVPTLQPDFAYLSSGTLSLLGTELKEPAINDNAYTWNITNEGGVAHTTTLLKNLTGFWLIQECKRAWRREGKLISYPEELRFIEQAAELRSFINPDDAMFNQPLHMPQQIQLYCQMSGQPVPTTEGEILRCIVESLAFRCRFVLERIERLTGNYFERLHIVGGGAEHVAFCRCLASALGRPVWAGPQEAAAIGNLLTQYQALGYISDWQQARQIVHRSFPAQVYEPIMNERWNDAYLRFCEVTGQNESV
ncbi:rhamnulokinase [Thermosporothrix hazakensis]|jgi:rhamnulokinase|uniref:Rhamnulokinase n=1 Tax=Thermosporothrix hazakensis TaxID=644383 RepID=A0A326UAF1_THEHA|nr:FGGY-family carbohydrate kinase [Thermosporothrix hazakensis]PZW34246.1 rhamnulokinase [Thermosporothrix hazakensis]GCE46203.1 hypothetical protein KTH_10720 [Thermosporothrix hazakensis]